MILLSVCENPEVLSVIKIAKLVIDILKISVPIILIVALMLDFARAVKDNDSDALAKANRIAYIRILAAMLVFFIPTFVNLIANNIGSTQENVASCLANANDEYINAAYVARAQKLVDKANKSLIRSDYNTAAAEVNKLKDKTEQARMQKELEVTLKKIKEKEEKERLEREAKYAFGGSLWFPIGGSKVETIGSKQFAKGTPTATHLTAFFGGNDSVHRGLGHGHGAIDIGASRGTYVIAAAPGVVVYPTKGERIDQPDRAIRPDANGKYNCSGLVANRVKIDHGNGTQTVYYHLLANTITVRAGDVVQQGQIIGKVGSSGCSTGPHLHFEVHKNGVKVDPEKYVSGKNPRP